MEPPIKDTLDPIKDTIEITSKQRTRFNVLNGDFPNNIFLTSDKGQPLNEGQNGQKTMGPKLFGYSIVAHSTSHLLGLAYPQTFYLPPKLSLQCTGTE